MFAAIGSADVGGTRIAVVAFQGAATHTLALRTEVRSGATVTVVASITIGGAYTTHLRVTTVVRASVAVITLKRTSTLTLSVCTLLILGANVSVITAAAPVFMNTAVKGIAFINRATVAVITTDGNHTFALALVANIAGGTWIIVITKRNIVLVLTSET